MKIVLFKHSAFFLERKRTVIYSCTYSEILLDVFSNIIFKVIQRSSNLNLKHINVKDIVIDKVHNNNKSSTVKQW